MVVQMAKATGARVATAAGSEKNLQICRELGTDLALNYKSDDIPARLRDFAPEGIDLWYETQREPDLDVAVPLLRKRGRMIVIAGRAARPVQRAGRQRPSQPTGVSGRHHRPPAGGAARARRPWSWDASRRPDNW